ncbi:hypothetical protein [Geobacter sp.]|uniref:hypothetical protein n=1 Tax=Geobacter sp. TaxID=46610 RepID=UPI002623573A|nr:hypothetical protein [Geobacter sp.]
MPHEPPLQEQTDEIGAIIDRVAAILGRGRDAFFRRKALPADDLKELHDLIEEIAFTAVREDERVIGMPVRSRSRLFRYQSILTHLHVVVATILSLMEALYEQTGKGMSLCEKAAEQTDSLCTQQEMILCTLAEAVRTGHESHLHAVCRVCRELLRSCQKSATDHERRVAGGLCPPNEALLFLTILDRIRSLVHHERETVRLLIRWRGTGRTPAEVG